MTLHRKLLALLALGLSLAPSAARAQAPDSAVFHRGQWGTEFGIGGGFTAVGLLRFTAPTRALLVSVGADYAHTSNTEYGQPVASDNVDLSLRLGVRRYHALERRIYRTVTVGLFGSYDWRRTKQDSVRTLGEGYGGGFFADIGATWLVTPHLGLGVKFGATASYLHSISRGYKTDLFRLSAGTLSIAGQFYF